MTDWTAGYVADINYTYGYYGELNPLRAKLALLYSQIACPEFGTACELGFGQGLSVNLHAAASTTQWFGTDFNPTQAGFAQDLARTAGTDARLYDDAFLDFVHRSDLPDFDYIGLHGIWSWVSDDNRAAMVDFIRRKLKVGGIVYVSYNTFPGWAAFAPMRHLMVEHAEILGSEGRGIVSRIDGAVDFAQKLLATNPIFARANPHVGDRLKHMASHNRHYLAHEYFNKDWHPMHFARMAEWMAPAKIQYACSAHYLDHVESINLTAEQSAFLKDIPDPMFRQSVLDFMINQQFRRDFWVKGQRRLDILEQLEQLRKLRFVLIRPRDSVSLKVTGALGDANMSQDIYGRILDVLADHRPHSFRDMEQSVSAHQIRLPQLLEAVLVLCGQGSLALAQDDAIVAKVKPHCQKLNRALFDKARSSNDIGFIASPLTGGGIPLTRFEQLFALATLHGRKTPDDCAAFVWQVLQALGQTLVKDGKTIETADEHMQHLTQDARVFLDKQMPILKSVQAI